jgi:hypothetical protein
VLFLCFGNIFLRFLGDISVFWAEFLRFKAIFLEFKDLFLCFICVETQCIESLPGLEMKFLLFMLIFACLMLYVLLLNHTPRRRICIDTSR